MLMDSQISDLIDRALKIVSNVKLTLTPNAYTEAFKTTLNYLIDVEDAKTPMTPQIFGPHPFPGVPGFDEASAGEAVAQAMRAQGINARFVGGFDPFEPRNIKQSNTRVVGPIPKTEESKGPSGPLTEQEQKDLLKE